MLRELQVMCQGQSFIHRERVFELEMPPETCLKGYSTAQEILTTHM